jgi:hypothetical protein
LPHDAYQGRILLREVGLVKVQDAVLVGRQGEHPLDALAVYAVFLLGHFGQQCLKSLLGGAEDDVGERVRVIVGYLVSRPVS